MENYRIEEFIKTNVDTKKDLETLIVKVDNLTEVKTELKDIKKDMDKISNIMATLSITLSSIDGTLKSFGDRGFFLLKYFMRGVFIIILIAMGIENIDKVLPFLPLETLKLLK